MGLLPPTEAERARTRAASDDQEEAGGAPGSLARSLDEVSACSDSESASSLELDREKWAAGLGAVAWYSSGAPSSTSAKREARTPGTAASDLLQRGTAS